jgi:HTH-type transcriptional regulator/antitoxin HigA
LSIDTDVFIPRWASAPGATLREVLRERDISPSQVATDLGISIRTLEGILDGQIEINADLAASLAKHVGASKDFWLARDSQYREDLRHVAADQWASSLPVSKMTAMGWIAKPANWKERLDACMRFFQLTNVHDWQAQYQPILQSSFFRTTDYGASESATILAWLRQCELVTSNQQVNRWDPASFRQSLQQVRRLTREKDPRTFIPILTALCAQHGVKFAVVRAPQGCPISGVARFIGGTTPMIALSARHLSDDHLWFTFFHEAGHLILHGPGEVYLDDDVELEGGSSASVENEANNFAEQLIAPHGHAITSSRWLSHRDVVREALKIGISSGVLAGQLQHQGILGHSALNRLKRRYKWDGSNLEMV